METFATITSRVPGGIQSHHNGQAYIAILLQNNVSNMSTVGAEHGTLYWLEPTLFPASWMASNQGLLESVINRLSKLPGKREFTASVLISQPRKSPESLFPYAPNIEEAEVYIQDVVILVSERIMAPSDPNLVAPLANDPATTTPPSATSSSVYISALEAVLYIFPVTHSVIVYISKVDSTGQGKRPSPTRALMLAFLEHVTTGWFGTYHQGVEEDGSEGEDERGWEIWIQLFARAQNQYLFPASIEFAGKRVLSDIGLVKWWRSVLDEYASEVVGPQPSQRKQAAKYIIIPGFSPVETSYALKLPTQDANTAEWIVGHPYSNRDSAFPLGAGPPSSISQLIPFFPDDPKARLIVEIANTTTKGPAATMTPPRKKRKLDDGQAVSADEKLEEGEEEDDDVGVDYLRTVSAEEFWERMDGRQECRLGTVAFFTVHIGGALSQPRSERNSTGPHSRPRRAEVPLAMVRKISASLDSADFGTVEKACRSTERLQDMIKALSLGITVVTSRIPGMPDGDDVSIEDSEDLLNHITRIIEVSNPELIPKVDPGPPVAPPVTVLAVRKKKKPVAT